jgi:hypothetical protein
VRRAVWSFWEAVAGSLSGATTAVSSAKVAVMESVDFYNEVAIRQTGVKDKEVVQWE